MLFGWQLVVLALFVWLGWAADRGYRGEPGRTGANRGEPGRDGRKARKV
jgi:hypothetical protein